MRFTAQIFVHGELVTRQLRGPGSHAGWRASWGVFRASMIMIGGASPSALDKYARGIEEMITLFPHAWGVISLADETMRAERWDILKESLGPTSTWEEVIAGSSFGFDNPCAQWWYVHVLGPLTSGARQSAASTVAALEGLVPGGPGHVPAPPQAEPTGTSTRNQPLMAASAKKKAKTACNNWNRGSCADPRCSWAHVCSGCGGKYPLTRCFTCNPVAKGAGKAAPAVTGAGPERKKKKGSKGGSAARSK